VCLAEWAFAAQLSAEIRKSTGSMPVKANPRTISDADPSFAIVVAKGALTVPCGIAVGEPKASEPTLRPAIGALRRTEMSFETEFRR
jgi:hypothetical protein